MTYSRQLPPLSPSCAGRIIPILEIAGAEAPAPGNGSGGRFAGAEKSGVGRTLSKAMNQRARFLPLAAAILFAGSALDPPRRMWIAVSPAPSCRSDRWHRQERAQAPRR